MLNLDLYLARIAYQGSLAPNLATLTALHRAHLQAIIYENLDIHFGRPLTLDLAQMFDKIVKQRRGGWCYEMNGLFAWVLQELGFPVTLLSGAVNRLAQGAADHLVLLISLDRPYLVDVGFGPGFLEPLPLMAGEHQQGFMRFRLGQEANLWRFYNDTCGGLGYDFTLRPCTLDDFVHKCHWLQTSPESNFTRLAVCHRLTEQSVFSLRGAGLKTYTADGVAEQVIDNEEIYAQVLRDLFNLELEQTNELWSKVWERHLAWVAENARR
ncbi:MAG: arylamine N-acetyltransferase [Caldilineaceae bacterium]